MENTDGSGEMRVRLKKALAKIRNQSMILEKYKEPIAIVGMACRFPAGANDIESYWKVLLEGKDCISEVPSTRWDIDDFYDPDPTKIGKMVTRRGGFLTIDPSEFDPDFFKISPREAKYMDPQQRLLLEVLVEALENAGIASNEILGELVSVFIGKCSIDYGDMLDVSQADGIFQMTGVFSSFLSGRLSFVFDFQGPNETIETACSSSLVAIHAACESLNMGEADLAVAGGVNLMLLPGPFIASSRASMLSPDGYCKTFDSRANGYVRSEGCGIVVLKRLSDAQRDNDHIVAIIEATGINHDGFSSGLTAPNGSSQQKLISNVCKKAKIDPADIDFIEAHGTGTALGDPIEVEAIGATYGKRAGQHPLMIGSVKSNMGHAEGAAGVMGLIKVALALQNEKIPANLHFQQLNPEINLNFPAEIVTKTKDWKRTERTRRAAISSFGLSGTNAHAILREAPLKEKEVSETKKHPLHIIPLSAKTESALKALIERYVFFLGATDFQLEDISYTACTGRNHERYRLAVIGKDIEEIKSKLASGDYIKGVADTVKAYEFNSTVDCTHDLNVLALAYCNGAIIDWRKFYAPCGGQKVLLPTYPFQRKRYWAETAMPVFGRKLASVHPLLGQMHSKPNGGVDYYGFLNLSLLPYLKDHKLYKNIVFPGAGYLEMMLAAGFNGIGKGIIRVTNVSFEAALSFAERKSIDTQVLMTPVDSGYEVAIYTPGAGGSWNCNAKGVVNLVEANISFINIDELKSRFSKVITKEDFYSRVNATEIYYGEYFQTLQTIYIGEREALGELKLCASVKGYLAHPVLLDGCLQLLAVYLFQDESNNLHSPIGCDLIECYGPLGDNILAHWQEKKSTESERSGDFTLCDPTGRVLLRILGMHYRKTNGMY